MNQLICVLNIILMT